jgi:hypothetical protein
MENKPTYIKFSPDWQDWFSSVSAVQENLAVIYIGVGWYLTATDTILITTYTTEDGLVYHVRVWNHKATRHPMLDMAQVALDEMNQTIVSDTRRSPSPSRGGSCE